MRLTKLDVSWKSWIWTNISNGSPKEDLFNILLNHGFDYSVIKDELDIEPTNQRIVDRKSSQLELDVPSEIDLGILYKPLADNPNVYRIESNSLEIYRIYNFLNKTECDLLITEMGNNFSPSTVTNPHADKYQRTSSTCNLLCTNKVFNDLNEKIHNTIKIPVECGETLQGQKYGVGQEFKQHTDYFHTSEDYNKIHLKQKGQRTWTFIVYLNDVEEGGETEFSKINKKFKPAIGDVLIWKNILSNSDGNPYSLHAGLPIIKGEKYIITKWFRER